MSNWRERIKEKNKQKEEEEKNKKTEEKSSTSDKKSWRDSISQKKAISQIDFDTFSDDLNTMNTTLSGIYGGWQNKDTMASRRAEVEGMYNRLLNYEDYRTNYGNDSFTDLSELANSYKSALDDWDELAEIYGQYENADAYSSAVKKAKEKAEADAAYNKRVREANLLEENSELAYWESILRTEKTKKAEADSKEDDYISDIDVGGYNDTSRSRGRAGASHRNNKEFGNYMGSIGYSSIEELEKAIAEKKSFIGDATIIQDERKALNSEDFEKFVEIGKAQEFKDLGLSTVGNKVEHFKQHPTAMRGQLSTVTDEYTLRDKPELALAAYGTEEEQSIYNFYLGQESEGIADKGTADRYIETIMPRLEEKWQNEKLTNLDKLASGGFWSKAGASALSVGHSLLGAGEYIVDSIDYAKTGEMDDNFYARASSTIRGRVSEDVDWKIDALDGWDAFDFVYNTGMSAIDSAAVMWMPGGMGSAVLGLSAAGQGVNDALDRGLSNDQAFWQGFASGAFEMAFEKLSIGNFKAFKDMPVDGWKTAFKNLGKTMFVNASEEMLTEFANIMYDTIAHGDLSQYEMRVQELLDSDPNMSEAEAKRKAALEFGAQIGEAGLSGGFMGFGFGSVGNAGASINTNSIGKSITANNNVDKVFNMAQISPEASAAYEAYTNYANKGISADNAKAKQVGALSLNLKQDAVDILNDSNSTEAEKAKAEQVLRDLDAYSQNTSVSRFGKDKIKELFGDKEKVQTLIDDALKRGEGTEAYKLASEYKAKIESGKELSEKELTKLVDVTTSGIKDTVRVDAEQKLRELGEAENAVELSKIISKAATGQMLSSAETEAIANNENARKVFAEMDKSSNIELMEASEAYEGGDAELFLENYEGGDIDKYRASFDFVSSLAKNNYDADFILEHRGALTPRQVQNIYSKVVAEPRAEQQRKLDELVKNHEGQLVRKANIDDSIFNGAKGQKLWRNLNSRQKKAITFVKAFAKGAGINLKITYDGKYKGKAYNGYYDHDTNTIVIDARAGFDRRYISEDAIIPTMSHELTHWMKQKSPELYAKLSKQIFDVFKAKGYTEYDLIATEQGKHPDMSDDAARDEIIARACEDLFKMSEEGKKIFDSLSESEKKTLTKKIKKIIRNLIDWANELLGLYESKSDEAGWLREFQDELSEIAKTWDQMLAKAVEVNAAVEGELGKIDAERITSNELDVSYSLKYNDDIAEGQLEWLDKNKGHITEAELKDAQEVTRAMVDVMMKYSEILPEDKIGKVLTKNGSYDRSVENTTICVRTLAYNEFVDKVQEEIGRPLTQMESFLVSQKLYDIATEPQCLYCYVSLDRKAFNDMLLRYMTERDTIIAKYNNSDKSAESIKKLYEEFLHGRKDTKEMKSRFDKWISAVDNGTQLLSLADIATEERQSDIKAKGGILAEQLADARKYAQSASWSKIQKNYVAYRDEILKLGDRVVKNLNEHYGLRWYSFSDYSAAFIVENMQQITDASIRGLKGLAYTKDTDFVEIFASTGMNINVSVFVNQDADGNFFIDEKESANFEKAVELRKKYPNVGIVATVTNDEALRWAGEQEWSDVIIPFHIVRTGTDVAEYYKWLNYTSESGDTIADKNLWEAYVDSLNLSSENARKKVSKNIYPSEHKNNKDTYLSLCESRGLSPRFARFAGEAWYMKLVNETRLSADDSSSLKPEYNLDAAKDSFQKFIDKGGYEGGWYKEGVDVDAEAKTVADDVLAGKKANEVEYGRQDGFVPEDLVASRKGNRTHGKTSGVQLSEKDDAIVNYSYENLSASDYYENGKIYSYDFLVAQKNMAGVQLPKTGTLTNEKGKIDDNKIVDLGIKNALSVGTKRGNKVYVENDYTKRELRIDNSTIKHGLDGTYNRHLTNARIGSVIGSIVKNAIPINGLKNSSDIAVGTYAMASYCYDDQGREFIAIVTVEQQSGNVEGIEIYDVAHAVSGRQKKSSQVDTKSQGVYPIKATNISISHLIEIVNSTHQSILSNDVLEHLGEQRNPQGSYSDKVLFSEKDTGTSAYDIIGEKKALEKRYNKLAADFENYKERVKLDKTLTKGQVIDPKQLEAVARYLVKFADSDYKTSELEKMLNDLYVDIQDGAMDDSMSRDEMYAKAYEVAKEIRTKARIKIERPAYYDMILKDIRSARIAPNDGQKGDAKHRFGDHYVGKFRGRVTIANDGTPLDIKWSEWASKHPSVFDKDIGDAQQLVELYDIYDDLRNAGDVVQEYEESEVLQSLATEIINKAWTVTKFESTADKQNKRIQELNAEHRKAMEELRESYEAKATATNNELELYQKLYGDMWSKRRKAYAKAKELGRKKLARYKENAERKSVIQTITANSLKLNKMLFDNNKDSHVPDTLKGAVKELLEAIDASSKRLLKKGVPTQRDISLNKAFSKLNNVVADGSQELGDILEDIYGSGLDESLKEFVKEIDNGTVFFLNDMSLEDLKKLDKIVKIIRTTVNKVNMYHTVLSGLSARQHGIDTIKDLDKRTKVYADDKHHFDKLKTKVYWNNLNPYYAFKNLGGSAQEMFRAFQDGQDKIAFLAKEVIDFADGLYTAKEYKKWSDTYFDFSIPQPSGKVSKFSMNVPQIMSLYCVIKQEDARNHILHGDENGEGGGITIAETKDKKAVRRNIRITEADLENILSKLDDKRVGKAKGGTAMAVADKLQEYMGTRGAELGNEITMARWGIKSFGIENYFPIKVSEGAVPSKGETPGVDSMRMLELLNASFTHSRNHMSKKSVEIGDVFDVFSSHMSDMIRYNALALPILDMYKWINYKGVSEAGEEFSLQTSVKEAFGDYAWGYLQTFLKDVSGASKSDTRDNLAIKFFKNSKIAKVAGNMRVALLQFTSFIRAGAVMDNKYLLHALHHIPKIKRSEEKSGIVLWKSLGYYDTDITRGLTDKIKHDTNAVGWLVDTSLKGAELADKVTMGVLWNACELEIRDTRKDLKVGSPEFNEAVALRLREVIYKTQVVDSMLTRSQMMRSPSGWDKMLTTFASESTLSLNLMTDIFVSTQLEARETNLKEAMRKNGKYVRKAITAYVMTNIVTTVLQSLFDAFRDYDEDDKDEKYWAKLMLENFAVNSSMFAKIPYINLFVSTLQGFTASRADTDWMNSTVKTGKEIYKLMTGSGDPEKLLKYLLKAGSDVTGIAAYNVYRDIMAFYMFLAGNS